MKKTVIILLALVIMLFAFATAASAESKPEYYAEISGCIARIQAGLDKGDIDAAKAAMKDLRSVVYRCARYLVLIKSYDSRILDVINIAGKAFENADYKKYLGEADALAFEILMDVETDNGSGSSHS